MADESLQNTVEEDCPEKSESTEEPMTLVREEKKPLLAEVSFLNSSKQWRGVPGPAVTLSHVVVRFWVHVTCFHQSTWHGANKTLTWAPYSSRLPIPVHLCHFLRIECNICTQSAVEHVKNCSNQEEEENKQEEKEEKQEKLRWKKKRPYSLCEL